MGVLGGGGGAFTLLQSVNTATVINTNIKIWKFSSTYHHMSHPPGSYAPECMLMLTFLMRLVKQQLVPLTRKSLSKVVSECFI